MPPSNLSVPDDFVLSSNAIDMLALKGTSTPPAAILHAPSSAPDDSDLGNNTLSPSIDEVNDALNVRVKYSDGTLETAIVRFVKTTITVGPSGADFTTIQAAWNYLKGRILVSLVTIDVAAGTYNEGILLRDQAYGPLIKIQGDTRTAAGQHFATTGSIAKSGSNCTITLVNTPPSDFTSSDFVIIGGAASAGNVGRFPIVSINTGAKTVTYVNPAGVAEAVRVDTRLIFNPDRIIDFTGNIAGFDAGRGGETAVSGFTFVSSSVTASFGCRVTAGGSLSVAHCSVFGVHDSGYFALNGGFLGTDGNCSAVKCARGFHASDDSTLLAADTYAADHQSAGYQALTAAYVRAARAIATGSVIGVSAQLGGIVEAVPASASYNTDSGFQSTDGSKVFAAGATARNNGVGYFALWQGLVIADSTSANNSGNTTNYSPGTSGTEGNNSGLIRWS